MEIGTLLLGQKNKKSSDRGRKLLQSEKLKKTDDLDHLSYIKCQEQAVMCSVSVFRKCGRVGSYEWK